MKKIFILLSLMVLLLTGCHEEKIDESNILALYSEKIDGLDTYQIEAQMEITNQDEKKYFDCTIKHKNPDMYYVMLKSKENNNVQVIVKNSDGVFVLTPSLNKSFRFKSDWPLNSFHAYLPESSLKELVSDDNMTITKENDEFYLSSKVASKTNSKLSSQKLTVGKDLIPKETLVYNANMEVQIKITFLSVKTNISLTDEEFDEEQAMKSSIYLLGEGEMDVSLSSPTAVIGNEEIVKEIVTETSILKEYSGDVSYMVYLEYVEPSDVMSSIKTYDYPVLLDIGLSAMSDNSLVWYNGNVMCAIYSDTLSEEEMVIIANSIY